MPESQKIHNKALRAKLSLIESLLQEGGFKQVLAEIRELEAHKVLDDISVETGELCYLGALALDRLGRPKQALTKAKKAYEILRNTEKNKRLAQVQQIMGTIYSKLGELKNAEVQFIDTASIYRRIKDQKGIAETYNELARICFVRSDFNRAIEYIGDALDICRQINDQKMLARLPGNLGTILMLKDQWEEAERNLLASLQANEALHDELYVSQSLLSLGHLYYLLRRFPKPSEYLQRAYLLISENNYLRELAIFHEYQGSLELSRGNFDSARQNFQEAVHIGEEIAPKSAIVSQAYRLLAEFQTERGNYQEALISCERSLLASRGIGEKLEEAITYRTLGRIHGQNGNSAKSKQNFDQAIQMLEEVGTKFELAKTYTYMVKCKSYEFWEKMKFLGWAEELTSRLDTPYYQAKVYVDFAQLFLQIHKFEVAKDFIKKSRCLFEKLNEKTELESLSALEKTMGADLAPGQSVSVSHSADSSSSEIITQNKTILEILENARQVMDLDITILLEGETGTGKDLLAKFIHYTSNRKNGEFVVVSCAAIPEGLFESELFGYKKGAFTGAVADKKGLVDEASGGTLYLDEIAEVPLSTQVKLLRAIEEKEIVRVGEVKPRKVDFRVIAATNKDMDDLVKDGKFRNDLFYRLNGMRFKLPPLRERKDDIPPLVEHFLKKCAVNGMRQHRICYTRRLLTVPSVDPKVMELLLNYNWPGNIRELENEVKKIFISSKGESRITPSMCNGILEKLINEESTEKGNLLDQRAEYEKEKIEQALAKSNGNKTQAARLLGISEALLRFKMKRFNITLP